MNGDSKALLRKFCLESSVLGLKYFYLYPDPVSRCFWGVFMLLTVVTSCVLSLLLYKRFTDMPTRIGIENHYTPILNMSFPAITICSPNQITVTAMKILKETLVIGNITVDLISTLPTLLGFYQLLADSGNNLMNFQNLTSLNRYDTLQIMGMLPQNCTDFLKICYLKTDHEPSCTELFNPILTKHGMCCIFNSVYHYNSKNLRNEKTSEFVPYTTINGGLRETLTVVTDYNPEDALKGTLLHAGAVRVMYTESHEFPADDESNLVYSHSESLHSIHATSTYCSEDVAALPYWSRQCYFGHEQTLEYFGSYHNSDCNQLCFVRAVERLCGCTLHYAPKLKKSRACSLTSIDCIKNTTVEMNSWYRSDTCICLRDCVSVRYQVEVSVGNLMALSCVMNGVYSDVQFNKSTSILHFYFGNSVFARQKQETVMSLINLSSNLGGVFGLCLGCSVISVLEIIFYVYCAIRNKIKRHMQRLKLKNKIDYIP